MFYCKPIREGISLSVYKADILDLAVINLELDMWIGEGGVCQQAVYDSHLYSVHRMFTATNSEVI